MSCTLPPEILDLIVDQLHDEPTTLEACCLVSKSWIPRTRRHLFARVGFDAIEYPIESWMETFPDPSNSPAHYTSSLSIRNPQVVTATNADVANWTGTFHNLVHLHLEDCGWANHQALPAPFFGFSPTVRSLRLTSTSFEVFDFVCSFPLLEDLALADLHPEGDTAVRSAPPTSPKLTGSLGLDARRGIRAATRRLLDFPNGLHFAKITVSCLGEDLESATDLVSTCSSTLESLNISCFLRGVFHSTSLIGRYLTTPRERSHA